MGLPIAQMVGGNLQDEELKKKISSFFNKYIDLFQEKLRERNLATGMFSFGRPTNYYFAIDRKNFHIIYSSQFAGGIAEVLYIDLREQQKEAFSIQEIASFLRAQKGITIWAGVDFDRGILDKPEQEQDDFIKKEASEHITKEYEILIQKHQPLFIPIEQITRFLQLASEDDFTNILLVPLLRHIGFKTAESKGHRDRSLEFGQDIQKMKIQLPTGHWLYFSAQVKKGDIKGSSSDLNTFVEKVLHQTYSQLQWSMPDPEIGISIKPDHVFLIVSGDITESAKKYIYDHELTKSRRVLLWEKDMILRMCEEKGLPETVQKTILDYNQKNAN